MGLFFDHLVDDDEDETDTPDVSLLKRRINVLEEQIKRLDKKFDKIKLKDIDWKDNG